MPISPEQVKNQEFPIRLKGYDPELVREFLAEVAAAYRATIRDSGAQWALEHVSSDMAAVLRAAHDAAEKVLAQAETEANEVRDRTRAEADAELAEASAALVRAEEEAVRARADSESVSADCLAAKELLGEAESQAEKILSEAEARADAILAGARGDADALERSLAPSDELLRAAAEAEQRREIAVQQEEDARSAVALILSEATEQARQWRSEAEESVADLRREAMDDREQARLLLEQTQARADEILVEANQRAAGLARDAEREARLQLEKAEQKVASLMDVAEVEARARVQSALTEGQRARGRPGRDREPTPAPHPRGPA